MKWLKSVRRSRREPVVQSSLMDGQTRKGVPFVTFLVNSTKGTIFLYSLDTSNISKATDKVIEDVG